MFNVLKNFYQIFLFKFKFKLILIQIISVINSVFQLISILSFGPLLLFLTNNNIESENKFLNFIFSFFSNGNGIVYLVSVVSVLFICSNLLNIFVQNKTLKSGHEVGAILGNLYFSKILNKNSINDISKNHQIINNINTEITRITNGIIIPLLYINSKISNVIFITIGLMLINLKLSLISISILIVVYLLILNFFKIRFDINSKIISNKSSLRQKIISESIYNFRETKVFQLENFFLEQFKTSNKMLSKSIARNQFLASVPRNLIEIFLFIILIYTIYVLFNLSLLIDALPIIAVYLVALYKLLPPLQNIASSYSSIKSNLQALKNILPILLEQNEISSEIKDDHKIRKIEISKLNFSFGDKKIFLDSNISLEKGKIVGIIGKTGVGKTTFLDLICGFIKPDKIEVKINDNKTFYNFDDCNFKKDIGLVTQKPLILNDTVIKNISFDLKKESKNIKLNYLKEMCSLDFVENLNDKWDTIIGEKNTKLSSGQMQRISIARSLYYDREILLLDEPTNNLDSVTEKKIINNLEKIKHEKIILLISHNLDNLEICDKIYEFRNYKFEIYEK